MRENKFARRAGILCLTLACLASGLNADAVAGRDKKKKAAREDAYAAYVWPPPPDEPRIRLVDVIHGRVDVEAESKWRRMLLGASPSSPYDRLEKPFAVAIDEEGRLLVTDSASGSLIRFDREGRKMDVFGTQGPIRLKTPLGMGTGPGGIVYVADVGLRKVVAIDAEGAVRAVYGKKGELDNPTDVVLSPDGGRLYVADSRAHRIVVLDAQSGAVAFSFGTRGHEDGEFSYPTSLAFNHEGDLFVVDQLNARVQVFTADGDYLDQLGRRGVGFGDLVRPKDIAVDEAGRIYVSDNAFNNIQIFDADFSLLTFVGEGGRGPGQFAGASGIAARDGRFAVVDQLGQRVQLFRYLDSGDGKESPASSSHR